MSPSGTARGLPATVQSSPAAGLQPDLLVVAKDLTGEKNITKTPRSSSRCCPPARPVTTAV